MIVHAASGGTLMLTPQEQAAQRERVRASLGLADKTSDRHNVYPLRRPRVAEAVPGQTLAAAVVNLAGRPVEPEARA